MKSIPVWVYYTVLRIVLFAVPLTVLLLLHVHWLISVVAAAVIGLCLSYLLLRRPREALARDLYELRHREKVPARVDDEVEDAVVDASGTAGDYSPSVSDSMAARQPRAWREPGAHPGSDAAASHSEGDTERGAEK